MTTLKYLFISFLYVLFWGVCFVDVEADRFSCFFGFLVTFFSVIKLNRDEKLNVKHKIIILLFPTLYTFVLCFIVSGNLDKILFNPLNFGLVLLVLALFFYKPKDRVICFLLASILTVGYTYSLYPKFKTDQQIVKVEKNSSSLDFNLRTIDLNKYFFYDTQNNPIQINSSKKKFLLTWNKTCIPCKKAVGELKDYFFNNEFDYYFINSPFKENDFDVSSIEKYLIQPSSVKIIDDRYNFFTKDLSISAVPYIFILDGKNQILYYTKGYNSNKKDTIVSYIE